MAIARISLIGLVAATAPVMAQEAPAPAPPAVQSEPASEADDGGADAEGEIVVTGSRKLPGSVVGDIPPDQTLSPADVRSFGVNSIADLLTELAPQTRSGRGGAPVVLLGGKRISGFQEIRDLPTEAIQRVEILPEEVALKYGYRADARVVNIVLRRRFRAATLEASDRIATEGGRTAAQGEVDLLSIRRDTRSNLHLSYQTATPLLESERDIVPRTSDEATAAGFDQTPFRTLLPFTRSFGANAVHARPLLGVQTTLNARVDLNDSVGRFGLPTAVATDGSARVLDIVGIDPLTQRTSSLAQHLGATATGGLGGWLWTATGNYDRTRTRTSTETGVTGVVPATGPIDVGAIGALPANRARSLATVARADLLVSGSPFTLPAGQATLSVRGAVSGSDFDSRAFRGGVVTTGSVSRDIAEGQANIDLPITRATSAIGQLSLSGNLAAERPSDFGTLWTTGANLNWSPLLGVRLIASLTDEANAPSPTQLGAPTVTTPAVRVFDFVRGTTATVTTVTGGNPLLRADDRRSTKLGLTLKPWTATDLVLTANYVANRTDDPIRSFPVATAAIEAAFPDRFARDAGGNLLRIDTRPVNLARAEQSELRWGINFSRPLKSKVQRELEAFRAGTGPNPFAGLRPPGGAAGGEGRPREGGFRGGGGGGRGGGGFGGRGGGGGGGRVQVALYHTWHFTDRLTIADGQVLDLLRGDAIGVGGGSPRHELEGQAGYTNDGLGARLSVNYRSATRVDGLSSADDLRFGDLATANLRLFADLGGRLDWVRAHPWLRGARVTVGIDNLFNARQRVTDATGTTPISYQPAYLDALGRSVRVSVRKLLF